jgi:hypothetical protein
MFRPISTSVRQPAPRRGALLIAVLGLLTLFAIFALFFVFYADAEATSSRIHREAQSPGSDGDFPAEYGRAAFNQTLGFVLFDDSDFSSGVLNPLRGHSLARSMYGSRLSGGAFPAYGENSAPFSGIGTFHENAPNGQDRALWINFSSPYTPNAPYAHTVSANTAFLDPERSGFRSAQEVTNNQLPESLGRAFIPKNAPYTYPDLKDLILASLSPATGEVLVPSLHRNWLFNSTNPNVQFRLAPWNPNDTAPTTNTAANLDWVTPEGRTRILRPRPVDQLKPSDLGALYPIPPGLTGWSAAQRTSLYNLINSLIASGQIIGYPKPNADGTYSGDIQNLVGGVGVQKNDSILVDIGMAPRQWNGRWIKPLASILLTDLDSMLNLNVHGNLRGPGTPGSHGSHAGFGPNEVNLGALLSTPEAANIVRARYGIQSWAPGTAYGPNAIVMNYGNFYQNVGPAGTSAAVGTGPTGTYIAPPAPNDGSVTWQDVGISIPRNGQNTLLFDRSGTRLPVHSVVNFDGGGNGPTITYPSFPGNGFQTNTIYSNNPGPQSFFDDNVGDSSNYNKYLNHPLLFNVNDWPSGVANRRTYPLSDTKRFNLRYAADRTWYTETEVWRAGTANASLIGQGPPFTGGAYRRDPAHLNRMLATTLSTSLDLPGLPGNFDTSNPGTFALAANELHPRNAQFQGTFGGTGVDFTSNVNLRNPRAALGPVDLNRHLADYRQDTNTPLHPNNMGNAAQAWADRHNLARDIFARLILATGANATVDGSGNITIQAVIAANPGNPDYNALRYLAQVAVNAVDSIDGDDVSTVFIWNPTNGMGGNGTLFAYDALGGMTDVRTIVASNVSNAADIQNRAVFGVEKPRLVINEAYSEVVNDPNEPNGKGKGKGLMAMNDGGVRFWIELLNPTATAYSGAGAIGTTTSAGATQIRYDAALDGVGASYSAYRLEIARASRGGNIGYEFLSQPSNVTGEFGNAMGTAYTPDARYDFAAAGAANRIVGPNNGNHNPGNTPLTSGILLVGPQIAAGNVIAAGHEFDPKTTNAGTWANMIEAPYTAPAGMNPATGMEYRLPPATLNSLNPKNTNSEVRRHIILLRRLANPYLAPSATNPYITVDFIDYVYSNDAIYTGMGGTAGGGEAIADRFSTGKVQPYAGYCVPDPNGMVSGLPTYSFAQAAGKNGSFVLIQSPNPASTTEPQHTFGRHNGRAAVGPNAQTYTNGPGAAMAGDTLMAPFDPFVHRDRPMVNQLELLALRATKPHEVTQYSIQNTSGTLVRNQGLVPWLGMNPANQPGYDVINNRTNNGLYRAFESLRVKPWTYGMASGGKVHGKININTVQDSRVLSALADPRNGNYFTAAEVNAFWSNMIVNGAPTGGVPYRTWNTYNTQTASGGAVSVPLPGPTYDDVANPAGNYDRPFRSFGAPEFATNGGVPAYRAGSGVQDTLLRTWPNGTPLAGQPMAWSTNTNVNVNGTADTGLQAEMLRKMLNNTTTVSHAFGISITIVFHEVRMNGANMDVLNEGAGNRYLVGREAFKDAPGDLRQQFYSVVDRSNLVLTTGGVIHSQPVSAALAQNITLGSYAPMSAPMGFNNPQAQSYNVYLDNVTSNGGGGNPYTIAGNPFIATVYADGKPFTIRANDRIAIGVGGNYELLLVNHVNQDGSLNIGGVLPGVTAITKPHAAGELVSNYVTGNPGPVQNLPTFTNPSNPGPFDPIAPNSAYHGIVPFAQRVR